MPHEQEDFLRGGKNLESFSQKKILLFENGADPQVTASIVSSGVRWGSESRLSDLLL